MSNDISKLGKYGLIGVMLALIALVGFSVRAFWLISSNHIDHSTQAFIENTKVLTEVSETNRALKDAIMEQTRILRVKK